ncbi:MAG: hypothetical protein DMF90_04075 [Acidobacteria bacterium]|nr:MAG: hypothetical protein DMF90_04075 [Acidobacteriota bacterium]
MHASHGDMSSRSAFSGQLSAVSFQRSAFSDQPSAISFQRSAFGGQLSAFRAQLPLSRAER